MLFTKVAVCGTDYIIPDFNSEKTEKNIRENAGKICERICGVGANGIVFRQKNGDEISAEFILSDNSKRTYDADGAVCLSTLYGGGDNRIHMGSGILWINRNENEKFRNVYDIVFEKAGFLPGDVPLACTAPVIEKSVEVGNRILVLTALKIGNVFAFHETGDIDRLNIEYLGERITKHSLFNKKANAVFAQKTDDDAVRVAVYRKNVGRVLSDIEAGAAALVCMCRKGSIAYGCPVDIEFEKGQVSGICRRDGSVTISAETAEVYRGIIDL